MEFITVTDPTKYNELYLQLIEGLHPAEKHPVLLSQGIDRDHHKESYFVMEASRPLACCTLYNNRFKEFRKENGGCIGNYECIEDSSISRCLLNHALNKAGEYGMKHLTGPMNGSTWFNYRFRMSHKPEPFITEAWNPAYYNRQFQDNGFKPAARYFSALHKQPEVYPMERVEQKLAAKGIRYRYINLDKYEEELKRIYDFSVKAFQHNYLFTPVSFQSFAGKYMQVKKYLDPSFIILAENDNKLAGMVFGIQDHLDPFARRVVLKTVATLPESKYWGLGMSLTNRLTHEAIQQGYSEVIHAYMLDRNQSTAMSKKYRAKPYVYYTLYEKTIV